MEAKDLRIGNWVNYRIYDKLDDPQEYFDLTQVDAIDLQTLDDHYYQPIPLTEEWMLKFGFEETDPKKFIGGLYTRKKTDGFYGFHINKETMSYCTFDYEGDIDDIIKIQYVHQLQNLYFAVTGEELEINETTKELE
jgi:hypothetical protein